MPFRLLVAALALALTSAASRPQPAQAGFERRTTSEGVELGIWYPSAGTPVHQQIGLTTQTIVPVAKPLAGRHPLVVISHGTGGDLAGHADTAVALARAGFVVAALTHPGDNWRDTSRATRIEGRPAALGGAISYLLSAWPERAAIDPDRVGAFGFSAGGFTVLAAAGGRPDMTRLMEHCRAHPAFFDCTMLAAHPRLRTAAPWPQLRDPRIKALVVAAPALGFTFDRGSLSGVTLPVQLWRADDDRILPAPFYADAVRTALPRPAEFHAVPRAGHFDFLAPCTNVGARPDLCASAPGFDRAAFHQAFNREIVRFFKATLGNRITRED